MWTRRKKFAVSLVALLLIGLIAIYVTAQRVTLDRYATQPRVVGLPPGYDPMATTDPYVGHHPSEKGRPQDPYSYPIPIGAAGPVTPTYGGPLEYPYACRSERSRLGQPLPDNQDGAGTIVYALDSDGNKTDEIVGYSKDCSVKTRVYYYYRKRESGDFLRLAADSSDVDEIVINGETIPFIVRLEMGTINRHIYLIAVLSGPDDTPEKPDLRYWNQRLIYQFRGGVGIGWRQGSNKPDLIPERRVAELEKGYAVAYSTANQTSNGYDIELAEDTVARVKRQFSARYGKPLHTIGIGGSGGAIQQYLIGQNRPGLLDAAVALYSYPDMITQTTPVMDCELLEYYFDVVDADNEKWQTWSQRSWIEGYNASDDVNNPFAGLWALQTLANGGWPRWPIGQTECTQSWRNLTPQIANPRYTYFASLFADDIVARTRWTYWGNLKRVYGTDAHGFARRTYDNVGVQYGLQALKQNRISLAEFINLNDQIGGWKPAASMQPERYWLFPAGRSSLSELSIWSHHNMYAKEDADVAASRSEGDVEAIAAAYRSGQVFLGQLSIPVIDLRHYLEPELDMHHSMQSFSARIRMLRGQGDADNQLIWFSRKPNIPLDDAFAVLEAWLENRRSSPALSVTDAKPDNATDRCYTKTGEIIASGDAVWDGVWNGKANGKCMDVYPIFSTPRIVAGDDYAGIIFKCHLQSVDAAIASGVYAPVDVASQRDQLQRIFADGVCDYTRGDAARPEDLLDAALLAGEGASG